MARRRHNQNKTALQALALVTQLGVTMIVSIALPCLLGVWLDRRFHTVWITAVMFVLGAAAGVQGAYRMIRNIYREDGKESGSSGEDGKSDEKGR